MDSIHDQRPDHDEPIEEFAHRVERAIGRDLVGVFRAKYDAGEQLVVLTSQTGVGGAADVVRGLPLPDELNGNRIRVQGFEDFCALMGNGDPAALYTATNGTVQADPLAALDELQQRCRSALDDPTAVNIDSLHSYLDHRAREARENAAFHITTAVEQLKVALLVTAQAHHAATDPDSDGDTTSLQRVLQMLTIDSLRGEIDDLVGIEDRDVFATLVRDSESLTAFLDATLSALDRYAHQVFGIRDGHEHE
jgi:hypothetical protein